VLDGFNQLWAWYVRGFDYRIHCQDCLKGKRSLRVSRNQTPLGVELVFDETTNFNQLYICGVAAGPETERGVRNLHLAVVEAPGEEVEMTTYNGYTLSVKNAKQLTIPDPPTKIDGLPERHYRCKNFRFGVKYYGYPGEKSQV
jgi:hypothetical protein